MATVNKGAKKAGSKTKKAPKAKAKVAAKGAVKSAKPKGAKPKKRAVAPVGKLSQPRAAETTAAAGGRRTFVLIVDDFADAREMYAEYFAFLGYNVATAENGLEAIEKATAQRPDVILMDLSLPVLDGWEATRRLKRDERTRAIPVIALTGNALAGHEEHARKAGCDSFLTKPCLPEDVEKEIQRILAVSKRSVA